MDTNLKEAVESGRQVCWLFISLAKELNKGRHRETGANLEDSEFHDKKSGKNTRARARITYVLEVSLECVRACTDFREYGIPPS